MLGSVLSVGLQTVVAFVTDGQFLGGDEEGMSFSAVDMLATTLGAEFLLLPARTIPPR
jgi:hypothetical protein